MTEYKTSDGVCIIHVSDDKKDVSAWIDKGSSAWYIKPTEKDMYRFDPERALKFMHHKVMKGVARCSKCGWEGAKSEFKFGQFAELLCVACIEDRVKQVEEDLKTGNVCRICRRPRSICCC
ncbi:MAG: hypothetical protein WC365_01260 [Candidatus Babeliales bacterium]|jgi:hypothetical protein